MEPFDAHIARATGAGIVRVVVNMARATVVNSRAFGSLLIAQKILNGLDGDLVVAELRGLAASVFKTLGMNQRIQSFALESEAVAHLQAAAE